MAPAEHRAHVLTTFAGGSALSDFRAAALVRRLQVVAPQVIGVAARFVHWVASDAPLTEAEEKAMDALLSYGEPWAGGDGPEPTED